MIKNPPREKANKKLRWLANPKPGHLVHYYKSDAQLLLPLANFIESGITMGDTCLVIATLRHQKQLNSLLLDHGVAVDEAYKLGTYVTLDANDMLAKFMINGLPDGKLFYETVGKLVEFAAKRGAPIRAFGEIVALLWKVGNKEAVIRLEEMWNDLSRKHEFSLYCAYPDLHFVMDAEARQEITTHHNLQYPSFSPA